MINQKHIDKNVLYGEGELKATREGFGEGLLELGGKYKNVVVLSADLKESTKADAFADSYPERFIEVGVAEQNLALVASGLAVSGKIPFICSYGVFSPGRNWEQIRSTICYNNADVKIAGHHTGLSAAADGATHQALEDIAIMRALPNMKVFSPCDAYEAKKITIAMAHMSGPAYIRLAREKTPLLTHADAIFNPGKVSVFWESRRPDVAILATGPIISQALEAAAELKKEQIECVVVNIHTIKPIDVNGITEIAKRSGCIVTVEEHQVAGGMGSAVSEVLAEHCPVPVEFVGMRDSFGQSGTMSGLLNKFDINKEGIVKAARKAIKRK